MSLGCHPEDGSDIVRAQYIINDKETDIESEKCLIHDDDKNYHCITCGKFICLQCGQSAHHGHDWKEIKTILKTLEQMKREVHDVRHHNTAKRNENREILDKKQLCLKSKMDALVEDTKSKYDNDITEIYNKRLEALEKEIEGNISSLTRYMSHNKDFYILAHTEQSLAEQIKDVFDSFCLETMKDNTVLNEADDSKVEEAVKLMVGTMVDFQKTRTILLSDFHMRNITQIIAVDKNLAWVGSRGEKEIKLINTEGEILRICKLTFALETFAICNFGQPFVSLSRNMSVQQIDVPRARKMKLTTYPTFICMTKSSDLLVTSITDLKHPTGKILKGSCDTFRNLSEIETGGIALTCPIRVTENSNGDLCVLNKTSNTSNKTELVIIKKDGPVPVPLDHDDGSLEISDIAFDRFGNIIFSESNRNAISLIFQNNEKFEKYNICQREKPLAIAQNGDYLWSSSERGNIQVHSLVYRLVCV